MDADATGGRAAAKGEGDPRRRAFLALNGIGFACVLVAAVLAWAATSATSAFGIGAIVLVLVGVALAIASYPFYRAWMRDELAKSASRKSRRAP
jgi:hypothetical protein